VNQKPLVYPPPWTFTDKAILLSPLNLRLPTWLWAPLRASKRDGIFAAGWGRQAVAGGLVDIMKHSNYFGKLVNYLVYGCLWRIDAVFGLYKWLVVEFSWCLYVLTKATYRWGLTLHWYMIWEVTQRECGNFGIVATILTVLCSLGVTSF